MDCRLFSCFKLPKRRHRTSLAADKSAVHVLGKQAPSILPAQHSASIPHRERNPCHRAATYPSNQHKLAAKIIDQELEGDADSAQRSPKMKEGKILEARDCALENSHANCGAGFVKDQDMEIRSPFAKEGARDESLEHISVYQSVGNKPLEDCLNVYGIPTANSCEAVIPRLHTERLGFDRFQYEREKLSDRLDGSDSLDVAGLLHAVLEKPIHNKLHLDLPDTKAMGKSDLNLTHHDVEISKLKDQLSLPGRVDSIVVESAEDYGFSCNRLPGITTYAEGTLSEYKHCGMIMAQKNASCMRLDGLSRHLYALSPSSSLVLSVCSNGEPTLMENFHGENMANSDSDVESQLDISLPWANFTRRESGTLKKSEKGLIYLNACTLRQESIIEGENGMFSDTQSTSSVDSTECPCDSLELRMSDPLQHQSSLVKSTELKQSISVASLQKDVTLSLDLNEQTCIFMQAGIWSQTEMAKTFPTGDRWSDDGDLFSSGNRSNELVDDATHKDSISLICSQLRTKSPPVGDLQPNDSTLSSTEICESKDGAPSKEVPIPLTTISSMSNQMLGYLPLPVMNIQFQQQDQLSTQTLQESHRAISKESGQMTLPYQPFSSSSDRTSATDAKLYNLVDDRPILGTMAAHWSHSTSTPKWWDGKGIPNSTNKYKEDQKVSWHATPFEVRLEQALAKQDFMLLP